MRESIPASETHARVVSARRSRVKALHGRRTRVRAGTGGSQRLWLPPGQSRPNPPRAEQLDLRRDERPNRRVRAASGLPRARATAVACFRDAHAGGLFL